ncbi:MAG: hypothetical protein ABIR30_13100 [Chitinophagaceae bacterium]
MKKIFFLLFLFAAFESFAGTSSDTCYHFKTGKFSYRDSAGVLTKIIRTKKQQTETNTKTGLLIRSTINWVGECSYELTQVWSNRKEQRKFNGSRYHIQITGFSGNSYEYACSCANANTVTVKKGVVIKTGD